MLRRKIIIVTGGGQGLGEAISLLLGKAGVTIVIADIQEDKAKFVEMKIKNMGGNALGLRLDVTDEKNVSIVTETVLGKFGKIDALINNAGVDVTKPLNEMTVSEWDRVLGVNLWGPFLMAKYVLPSMIKKGKGHIINITSTAAKRAWPNASAYHASKWGLLGFSHALFTEAREHNVKVTAVIAGGMKTPFILERFPDVDQTTLQSPINVAETIKFILDQPEETIIPEVMVIPLKETSWP